MASINNNSSIETSSSGDDLLVVSFWSTILVYALITNTLTVIGILRSRSMRSAASYWIVISLSVCDLVMIVISLIHIIPATYLHEEFVEIRHARTIWAMFAYNVFWYAGVVQLAAMAVNRFVSIVFPLQYKRVFAPKNTLLIIFSLYLLGLLSSLPSLHDCCYIVYDHHSYVTYYWPEDSDYMWLDILLNSLSVLTMILCYAAILLRVRKSSMARRKHQMVALAAKARRNSNIALLSVGPSTTDTTSTTTTGNGLGAAPTKCQMATMANGTVVKDPRAQRLLKQHLSTFAMPASSSLSTINNNNSSKIGDPKKKPVSRTSSASSILTRARLNANSIRRPQARAATTSGDVGATQRLLAPQPAFKLRRPAGLSNSKRRNQQQPQQASRREIRLFVQFFVVSLVFLSTWVTWQWLPRIPGASKWIYFATTTFFFINNAVNPTVYLIFNSGLRHQVKALFCPEHVRKCDTATKAAVAAAAAMGGNRVVITRYNSSSSESDKNNRQVSREAQGDYSAVDTGSNELLKSSSNLAAVTDRDCSDSMQTWRL